jgi:hypothetical protein
MGWWPQIYQTMARRINLDDSKGNLRDGRTEKKVAGTFFLADSQNELRPLLFYSFTLA